MAVRDQLLSALRKDLLGPRNGIDEVMESDPESEYQVGVLEPAGLVRDPILYFGTAELTAPQDLIGEEDEDESNSDLAAAFSALDPRALAKSMGISFVTTIPTISFCATWARYEKVESNPPKWERKPAQLLKDVDVSKDKQEWRPKPGVRLSLRSRKEFGGNFHVSLFLVNETVPSNPRIRRTEELVFQPQIRVFCDRKIAELPVQKLQGQEEPSLTLLYRNRRALARGHLCSAVWHAVDPEKYAADAGPEKNPFYWWDGQAINPDERKRFSQADVRTEYIPVYSIEQRITELHTELSAGELSDSYDPQRLKELLSPVLHAYASWVDEREKEIGNLNKPALQETARAHISLCREAISRMRDGLGILLSDADARVSFCFMNRAMHLQSSWKTGNPLHWRAFQIGFILLSIPGLSSGKHPDRQTCDVLWFPTGGGKTEAYLGLAIFSLVLRRRQAIRNREVSEGAGTAVLSRYTLRLLTLQQFRRTVSAILACDLLRCQDWRPKGSPVEPNPWGRSRFSVGLWVGGDVTPNRLMDHDGWSWARMMPEKYPGALRILQRKVRYAAKGFGGGEPAQILECPVCKDHGVLAISNTNLPAGTHEIHWIVFSKLPPSISATQATTGRFDALKVVSRRLPRQSYHVISVWFRTQIASTPDDIEKWWREKFVPILGDGHEQFAHPSRPGYFVRRWGQNGTPVDFEIHCPNPDCPLNKEEWSEICLGATGPTEILPCFQIPSKSGHGFGVPISAYVVDDQVYHRCPSMVIATVDKFARLAFEPRASGLFGNVNQYDSCWGYNRDTAPPDRGKMKAGAVSSVQRLQPPSLIIQDELHLIEGPLGSMVGLYETAVDLLCTSSDGARPKYIASSATVRHVADQVRCVFDRKVFQFPPPGTDYEDTFFSTNPEPSPFEADRPGRVYVGVCAPGRGSQTPVIRVWSILLQMSEELRLQASAGKISDELDQFCTVIGYFNAIRELANGIGLYRQDMVDRLKTLSGRGLCPPRELAPHMELSSNTDSADLPGYLARLSNPTPNGVDGVFATSMFGTGVDVERLGLMVVHGQPKTTSNYIQATGRIGRKLGGLVVTILRASKPRDLDHYEFFVGYHRSIHRYVEPIAVYPFSPMARDRALGPISVALLRNAEKMRTAPVDTGWAPEDRYAKPTMSGSRLMATHRTAPEIIELTELIVRRAVDQSKGRRPNKDEVNDELLAGMSRWSTVAKAEPDLLYSEPTLLKDPTSAVVLGDPQHQKAQKTQVFRNSPQSLREVEATVTFQA